MAGVGNATLIFVISYPQTMWLRKDKEIKISREAPFQSFWLLDKSIMIKINARSIYQTQPNELLHSNYLLLGLAIKY